MRIAVVAGTRPEGIKVAPLVLALRRAGHDAVLAATGQHREMLQQVLDAFSLRPDVDLGLDNRGLTLAALTAESVLRVDGLLDGRFDETLGGGGSGRAGPAVPTDGGRFGRGGPGGASDRRRFDALVVQGDTTAAFVGALAAFYRQVPVVHLEAGLRTGDRRQPWPEEANRQLVSRIADLHLAPSRRAVENLRAERAQGRIVLCGNTVIDALQHVRAARRPWLTPELSVLDGQDGPLGGSARLLLVTLHRREAWSEGIALVAQAIAQLAAARPDVRVVFPVHRNPIVRQAVRPLLDGLPNVLVTEPVPYPDMVGLLDRCHVVLTDSGGLQEEAPALGKPVLVCRATTERPEAVEAGVARLVGTDPAVIVEAVHGLYDDPAAYGAMANAHNPYGDGTAAEQAVAAIEELVRAR